MRALLLGSGGHIPTGSRETCCALLRDGAHALVIDAGTGLRRLVTRPELLEGVRSVDLVLTHFHLDHTVGIAYLGALAPEVVVWGPGAALYGEPTAEVLGRLLAEPLHAATLEGLTAGVRELPVGEVALGPFALRTRRQERHAHPTLGLRVGDELAYCTDTAYDEGTAAFARGARVLCHEAWYTEAEPAHPEAHTSGRGAGELARAAGVARLVLIHLNPTRGDHDALLAEARHAFPAAVLGEDELDIAAAATPGTISP